jgi:hypothetical protein
LVSTGRELLLIGGLGATGQSERTVYRLDRPDGSWQDAPNLPDDRAVGGAAWDGSRVVFAGGVARDGEARADVWSFDGAAWRRMGDLQVARDKLAAVSDGNGEVWFLGGRDPATERPLGDVDVVRRRPTYLGEQVQPVQGAAGVWWPGAGPCLVGGGGGSDGKRALDLVQCPPVRGPTITPPPLPQARIGLGAAVLNDVVYAVGGFYAGVNGSNLAEAVIA